LQRVLHRILAAAAILSICTSVMASPLGFSGSLDAIGRFWQGGHSAEAGLSAEWKGIGAFLSAGCSDRSFSLSAGIKARAYIQADGKTFPYLGARAGMGTGRGMEDAYASLFIEAGVFRISTERLAIDAALGFGVPMPGAPSKAEGRISIVFGAF